MKNRLTNKAFTLLEAVLVAGIISVVTAISMPNMLKARVTADESAAQAALKTISIALENYSATNNEYPPLITDLVDADPPYLLENFFDGLPHNGYLYQSIQLDDTEYIIQATPSDSAKGGATYQISTGAVLTEL